MELLQAVFLGVVQGLTEFLPVSSSGHLIFFPALFGWEDQGLLFDVVVHLGTLLAVVVYFHTDIFRLLRALFNRAAKRQERRLAWIIAVSIVPAIVVALLFGTAIETTLRSPSVIAFTLIGWGLVLAAADWYAQKWSRNVDVAEAVTWKKGMMIACAQALALVPGTSRSGITMTAGLFAGFSRAQAARFSFLMSVPVIFLAGVAKIAEAAITPSATLPLGPLVLGFIAAALSGFAAIAGLMRFVQRRRFTPFVIYRVFIGLAILLFLV